MKANPVLACKKSAPRERGKIASKIREHSALAWKKSAPRLVWSGLVWVGLVWLAWPGLVLYKNYNWPDQAWLGSI